MTTHREFVAKIDAERKAAEESKRKARDEAELERLTDRLRRSYLLTPGATEESFEAALPDLLDEHRQQAMKRVTAEAQQSARQKVRRYI